MGSPVMGHWASTIAEVREKLEDIALEIIFELMLLTHGENHEEKGAKHVCVRAELSRDWHGKKGCAMAACS